MPFWLHVLWSSSIQTWQKHQPQCSLIWPENYIFNLISAGVLENQDMLDGGQYVVKMFTKKICPKNEKLYIFEMPLTMPFQICKSLITWFLIKKNWKCENFLWQVVCKKLANFFSQNLWIRFLMSKAFQKPKFYQNLTSGSGSKQRFSLLQEKAVIQAVCLRTQAVSIKARF